MIAITHATFMLLVGKSFRELRDEKKDLDIHVYLLMLLL